MNHNSEAKGGGVGGSEEKEQFQVHALIDTDREEIGSAPERVPADGSFSVPRSPPHLHRDSKQSTNGERFVLRLGWKVRGERKAVMLLK